MVLNEDHPATRGAFISQPRSPNCRAIARFSIDGLFSEQDSKRRPHARAYFQSSRAWSTISLFLSLSLSLSLSLESFGAVRRWFSRERESAHETCYVRFVDDGIEINRRRIVRRC